MLAQTCSKIGSDQLVESSQTPAAKVVSSPNVVQARPITITAASSASTTSQVQTSTVSQVSPSVPVLQNVTLLPQMQSINIGGQEALFIPAQNSTENSNVVQLGGHTSKPLQLGAASAIPIQPLNQNNPVIVQANGQAVQQVPSFIQIPVSTANGQTIYQTIQIGTVPIPISNTPLQLNTSQSSTQSTKGIIAEALATSQVQLNPSKKAVQQQTAVSQPATTSQSTSETDAPVIQASQLVQTSNGFMVVPYNASTDTSTSPSKTTATVTSVASPDKQTELATLVSVPSLEAQQHTPVQLSSNQVW